MDELEWVRRLARVEGWAESPEGQQVWAEVLSRVAEEPET